MEDGSVATWSICTISGKRATYYYAASRTDTRRSGVTDKLFYFACCELGARGCEDFDLMGIGSDFSPSLKGLNTFKTKFAKEVTHVAPDRDVPVKGGFYRSLQMGKRVLSAVRERTRG
jgi:lipid II:glycine glycyltransferase (peptidoglycan interpeptide bridge formation enzyme)